MGNDSHNSEVLRLGEEICAQIKGERPGVFDKDFWQGKILEWAMQDESFKVDMFRLVDVLPVLSKTKQISNHVREYLLKEGRDLPTVLNLAIKAASSGITAGLGAKAIKKNVTDMAVKFIIGTNAKEAIKQVKKFHNDGLAFTVDLLGEYTVSEKEAIDYQQRYLDLINHLPEQVYSWQDDEIIDTNHLGSIPRANVSIKISSMDARINVIDFEGSVKRLKKKILPLFLAGKKKNVFINMDLEQWEYHDITYQLFEEIVMDSSLEAWPHLGIVIQAYHIHSLRDVERLIQLSKKCGFPITVRLVKGAYWDYEVVHAKQYGYECPVFTDKAATDENYEKLSRYMLENIDYIHPAFASHNLRSITNALVTAKELHVPHNAFEIQMLYGMAEPERKTFRSMGYRVRIYAPVGELLPGMAYLVRRLLENTANSGFLKLSYHDEIQPEILLRPPQPQNNILQIDKGGSYFENCLYSDFTIEILRQKFADSASFLKRQLPLKIPVVINGKETFSKSFSRVCPSQTSLEVSQVSFADAAMVNSAVESSMNYWTIWRDKSLEERVELLEKLANILERDRYELAAIQILEVAKPWAEADADVAEAVDFCRYYAKQALIELKPKKQGNIAGEENWLFYEGRGPVAVIAPWNFPLAIICGMTVAAAVAGNTVLLKPAEQSSANAYALYVRMIEAGFPCEAVQFLPGEGGIVGRELVNHHLIAQIAFTGSKDVGLHIIENAAKTKNNQPQVKRVICEMGGKNATIIDEDADLDVAIVNILKSSFGYAGQKCSACSRVFIVGEMYEPFKERLIEAAKVLNIAPAENADCDLGPVIDEDSYKRLNNIVLKYAENSKLLYSGETLEGGYFVAPQIYEVTDEKHGLMQDEFFGPILTIMKVKDFDEALAHSNATQFALTGAVFTRTPSNQEKAKQKFRVGNLYLNKGSTGAMVNRQPFGGFAMSGIGTKAGGPGYLLNFVDPRTITENTMRSGFTPDILM